MAGRADASWLVAGPGEQGLQRALGPALLHQLSRREQLPSLITESAPTLPVSYLKVTEALGYERASVTLALGAPPRGDVHQAISLKWGGEFQFKFKKKTLIIPQGAILLRSWRARQIMNT